MNDVHLDHEREARIGQPEIVYGQHKNIEQIVKILGEYRERNESAFISRISKASAIPKPTLVGMPMMGWGIKPANTEGRAPSSGR